MASADLIEKFSLHLDAFETYQGFADKARALADRFSPDVVDLVAGEYDEAKLEEVGAIMVLQADLEAAIGACEAEHERIASSVGSARLGLEELELRLAIGDLDDEAFARESFTFTSEVDAAESELVALDDELEALRGALGRWEALGLSAGVLHAA